ncbi:uncharacterized protein LOC132269129 [Cornus florida]|uniref:uncharacterized protein LOC132269129 n=1 Tax=Cornus florida TaxID=4283 RepID=UPI0028A0B4D4|nr:uncharacterized protein LOC132269129 [Cornus florida]
MDVYSWFRRSLSRSKKTSLPSTIDPQDKRQEDDELFGVTDQLIDFVKSFTLDTFKTFPLLDEQESNFGDDNPTTSGNIRKDLSDWQERHATIILSRVKDLSLLRLRLCPRHLKERQFWRVYFTLVKSYVAEYELHAIRLAKLKGMTVENENLSDRGAYEVEMSETKQVTDVVPSTSSDKDLDSLV